MKVIKKNKNVWNKMPLSEYEKHMSHESVGQLDLLNRLTKKYYQLLSPQTVLILGIAGGNGLEHIDSSITQQVVGVDINGQYLRETQKRYATQLANLTVVNIDIRYSRESVTKADFIWAALLLEYTRIEPFFEFVRENIADCGHLLISIQSNNGVTSISQTGVEKVKILSELFQLVEPSELAAIASRNEFEQMYSEENFLPNGKSIKTYHYQHIRLAP